MNALLSAAESLRFPSRPTLRVADLFCGAGGSSTALVEACAEAGYDVQLTAVNHWKIAIATHTANHPDATHLRKNVDELRERELSADGQLDLLIASPSCSEHSYAKGGKSIDDQNRVSIWTVIRETERYRPKVVIVENVRNLLKYGPIEPVYHRNGKPKLNTDGTPVMRPIAKRKGELFRAWIAGMEALGYHAKWDLLNAADYGDPQTRVRLFIVFTQPGIAYSFPLPTHGKPGTLEVERGLRQPWVPARDIIDFSVPSQSIFDRVKPLSPNTMRRIVAGLRRYCSPEVTQAYLVVLRRYSNAQSLDDPTPTVVAGGNHLALAEPELTPYLVNMKGQSNYRGVEEPAPTLTAHAPHLYLAEPEANAFVVGQQSNAAARSTDQPLPTIATGGKIRLAEMSAKAFVCGNRTHNVPRNPDTEPLATVTTADGGGHFLAEPHAEPFLLGQHGGSVARSLDEPVPTVTQDGYVRVFDPIVVDVRHGDRPHQPKSIDEPLGTVTSKNGAGIVEGSVEPFITSYYSAEAGGERTRDLDSPLPTVPTANRFGMAEPFITARYTAKNGNERTRSSEEPLPTVTSDNHFGVAEPFITSYAERDGDGSGKSTSVPHSLDDPLATVLTRDRFGVAEPFIVPQQGHGTADVDSPLPTVTTTTRGMRIVKPYLAAHFGERQNQEPRTHSVDEPAPTVTGRGAGDLVEPTLEVADENVDPRRLVELSGVKYVLDIKFRMLQPKELALAQGFRPNYIFTGTKTAQTAQIGNAVPRQVAKALAREAIVAITAPRRKRTAA
jgi:DNA (cytosine-5)-methyltransferase 1